MSNKYYMTLTKSQKIILYIAAGAVIIFGGERFFISGLYCRFSDLHRRVKLAESELKKAIAIQKTKDKITADYEESKPYLELAAAGEKQVIAQLLKEIESIISASGGTVVNLNPQEKSDKANVYKADFRLELTFRQLIKFLSEVERSKLLIKLDKIAVTSKDEAAAALRIDGVVSITIP